MEAQNSITLSDITNLLEQGALLREQGQWHLVWGPFQSSKELINHEISIFCPDFYDSTDENYWQGERTEVLSSELLSDLLESFLQASSAAQAPAGLRSVVWQEPSLADYRLFFQDVQKKIRQGQIRKAVPVVFAKALHRLSKIERAQMILQLIHAPANLHVYGFWNLQKGILGATPETLFRLHQGRIQSMALAGTCPKSESTQRPSLLEDPKEREEHELVLQDICEVLGTYGQVQKSATHLLELPTLWHLKTDVLVAAPPGLDRIALVHKMHPTPALGVFPRQAGYHWMQDYADQQVRARFGAPFMFVFPQRAEAICLVAIRNLQWNRDELLLGSGAGVVAASELEREWRELAQKRESVRKILGV